MRVGVNAHPPQVTNIQRVLDMTPGIVRFPPWSDYPEFGDAEFDTFINRCVDNGVEPLIICDDRTNAARRPGESWVSFFRRIRKKFPRVNRFQILNEVDGTADSASGPKSPKVASQRLLQARLGMGDNVILYSFGLVGSGGPPAGADYLAEVDPKAIAQMNYVAFHIYGNPPRAGEPPDTGFGTIEQVLESYSDCPRPLVVTEIGGNRGLWNDEHERAVYVTNSLEVLYQAGVEEVDAYALTYRQYPEGSLLDENDEPFEAYAAYKDAQAVA